MEHEFPAAVPEIPVTDLDEAIAYYVEKLGFTHQFGDKSGDGIAGVWTDDCRLFLTTPGFREQHANTAPIVIWLNLSSIAEVDALNAQWLAAGAKIVSPPESKPWKLHEFTAADLDGNLIRVFYDFRSDTQK
jgi:uncharacterized glyoxalase superfamily protein PhnB